MLDIIVRILMNVKGLFFTAAVHQNIYKDDTMLSDSVKRMK